MRRYLRVLMLGSRTQYEYGFYATYTIPFMVYLGQFFLHRCVGHQALYIIPHVITLLSKQVALTHRDTFTYPPMWILENHRYVRAIYLLVDCCCCCCSRKSIICRKRWNVKQVGMLSGPRARPPLLFYSIIQTKYVVMWIFGLALLANARVGLKYICT